ncbi:hypothetical protein ASF81_14615 [Brevundimonas sp. Leaf168]|nr:hypothetical protein ASF81_14615 [Brevundimonas sp. Leaf168]
MMDVLIFMAGGVTALIMGWLVKPIIGGLIEGMDGGTRRIKTGRISGWLRVSVDIAPARSFATEDVHASRR